MPLAIPFLLLATGGAPPLGVAAFEPPPGAPPPLARPAPPPELARIAARLEGAEEEALALLSGYVPLLRFLPLEALAHVRFDPAGTLELAFDFDGRSKREVELPAKVLWVLDPEDGDDPLLHGRPQQVKSKARTLIVHRTLRFAFDDGGIRGVADGDLEIAVGPFAPNVALTTEHRADAQRDEDGRLVLAHDPGGAPRREEGRWVPVRSRRWLVLEVKGRRFELPLDVPTDQDGS